MKRTAFCKFAVFALCGLAGVLCEAGMNINRKSFIGGALSASMPMFFAGCRLSGSNTGVVTKKLKLGVHFREAHDNERGYYGVVGDPAPGKPGIDWHTLLEAMREDPATQWGIFEPTTSNTFGTVRRSLDALKERGLV